MTPATLGAAALWGAIILIFGLSLPMALVGGFAIGVLLGLAGL